ncbi:MAG: single-stranded-DNA-specific exonuclease RecJ [Bacteroidales bacterium]
MTVPFKHWIIKPRSDNELIKSLSEQLKIHPVLANLLIQRGIDTIEKAKSFFVPSLNDLHDPFLMKDMNLAVNRLLKAIHNNEKILIYGDYDVDGTTAVSLFYLFLKKRYNNISFYIPNRYDEGYGISIKGIDFAAQHNFNLVIALDCGIKAIDKINYANKKNVDFIICDHHLPGDTIPNAVAVLDPKRNDCSYPFKDLSGCGVGFKFLQAYCQHENIPLTELFQYLDLVAVSIASDIVPIIGENRVIAHFGLKKLNENPIIGLKALKDIARVGQSKLNINDIVFKIGPRINAAGRIENGTKAVELLTSETEAEARRHAREINECNEDRKSLDQKIFNEAIEMIENDPEFKNKKTTVLFNQNWHKGVIGIVASRLIEYYYRPTIILTQTNGMVNGSARTVDGFDLYNAIDRCGHLLENYGGHMYAAGLSLKPEKLSTFVETFEKIVSSSITDELLIPHIEIDDILEFKDIDARFFKILHKFEPFGPGNMTPIFASYNVYDTGSGKTVGKNNEHLKLDLKQESSKNYFFPAIGFNLGYKVEELIHTKKFNICYSIDKVEFMDKVSLQLRIRDIQLPNEINKSE